MGRGHTGLQNRKMAPAKVWGNIYDAQGTVGALSEEEVGEQVGGQHRETVRGAVFGSHPTSVQPEPLWGHIGQREKGPTQAVPEPGGDLKSAALQGPSRKGYPPCKPLFEVHIPIPLRGPGLGQEGCEPSQERGCVLLGKAG